MTRTLPSSLLLLALGLATAGATTTKAATATATGAEAPGATVVIYRSAMREATTKLPVRIDQTPVGDTVAHSYLRRQLSAGPHRFDNGPDDGTALTLDLQPGQIYFIEQDPGLGPFSTVHLRRVDAAAARDDLAACLPLSAADQWPASGEAPSATARAVTDPGDAPNAAAPPPARPVAGMATVPATAIPPRPGPVAEPAHQPSAAPSPAPVPAAAEESSAPLTTGLAIEDPRVDEQAFTAAQHIATGQQCDAMLRLQSVQGEHAVFYTQCKARQQVLYIGCDGDRCRAQPGAAP